MKFRHVLINICMKNTTRAGEQKKAFLHTPLEVPKFTHEQMWTLVDTWDHYLPDLDLVPRYVG